MIHLAGPALWADNPDIRAGRHFVPECDKKIPNNRKKK